MLRQMASSAALIAEGSYPLVTQIVLSPQGVVVCIGCRPIGREGGQVQTTVGLVWLQTTGRREIVAAKRHDGGGICRISCG